MLNKLRLNLTLLNTFVLVGILIAISAFLYFTMRLNLANDVDSELSMASEQLSTYINYFDEISDGYPRDAEKDEEYNDLIQKLLNQNITTVVWNEDFDVMRSSIYLQLPNNILNDLIQYNFQTGNIGGEALNYKYGIIDMKIFTNVYVSQSGEMRVVQTIKNMNAEIGFLNWLLRILLIAVFMGMTLSLAGGYIISGRSIIPVKESIKKQQEFVANVSHELRTPIAVVLTNLDVIKTSPEETVRQQWEWLNNAYNETKRMEKVVTDLLFLAKVDAGQINLEREKFNLAYLITDTSEKLMPLAAKKNISIYNSIDDKIMLNADRLKMMQLAIILIDNSIKYSAENSAITISSKEDKGYFILKFKDHGIGIAGKDLEKIYERFYRADKARSRDMGGTGLGLSIAKWIADEHDWHIEITSKPSKGTTASVFIPMEQIYYEEE
ncbi:MAG TPA: two-component sensor histidine kinase [Eubacteriaceae bacterium]|jgi:signal transduction histidine kinase|nr:two-component sensor histidine kinase [Eubacteriaceae bacterium]